MSSDSFSISRRLIAGAWFRVERVAVPSPMRLRPSTVMTIAMPGTIAR